MPLLEPLYALTWFLHDSFQHGFIFMASVTLKLLYCNMFLNCIPALWVSWRVIGYAVIEQQAIRNFWSHNSSVDTKVIIVCQSSPRTAAWRICTRGFKALCDKCAYSMKGVKRTLNAGWIWLYCFNGMTLFLVFVSSVMRPGDPSRPTF